MSVEVWDIIRLGYEAGVKANISDEPVTEFTQWLADVGNLVRKANARGDGVAVYVNNDLGHPDLGQWQVVSYGSTASQLETRVEPLDVPWTGHWHEPDYIPLTLPDIGGRINWRYQLLAICPAGEAL